MRSNTTLLGGLLARALPFLSLGCGVAGNEPLGHGAGAILNGTNDVTDTAVVAIDVKLPTGEELCTGYLIMPDLVLTARHCAAPVINPSGPCATMGATLMASGGSPVDPSKVLVGTDTILTQSSKTLAVAEVTVLPDSTGQSLCGNDLAILRLAAPIEGITPIALAIAGPPIVGAPFTGIGYGVPMPTDVNGSGTRRERADLSVATVGATNRTVDAEWIADTGPCAGDSGSPAIGADGASFGVMSRGPKATCISMIYERVDTHADFLIDQAKQSATRLGVAPPAWAGGGGGGGAGGTGGQGGKPAVEPPEDANGGCNVGGRSGNAGGPLGLLALGAVIRRDRRRRSRCAGSPNPPLGPAV